MTDKRPPLFIQADADLTLDPADWEEFRKLCHQMVDDNIDYLKALRDEAPWTPTPAIIEEQIGNEPLPEQPQGARSAYEDFLKQVRPYSVGNRHPRFWGWMKSNGTPLAMMSEMLAASMNAHLAGFNHAPKLVELQVIKWLATVMGFPATSSGILASGGTMANIIGLAVARHAQAGFDVRAEGLFSGPRMTVYASVEMHSWLKKCVELLGLGRASIRSIPVDSAWQADVAAMRRQIEEDRAAGLLPLCIVGSAGTINTGSIDDLQGLADLAEDQGLWFHIDGAIGSMAAMSPNLKPLLKGMERADSLAFDLHKWGFLPYEIACVLVRDADKHHAAFETPSPYLQSGGRGVLAGGLVFANRGPELSRNFKALKAWMSLKAEGTIKIGAVIEQNVAQARRFATELSTIPEFVIEAPVSLNVVCWRANPPGSTPEQQDALNRELLVHLQETGVAICSSTVLHDRFVIRLAVANHRSRWEDYKLLLASLPGALQKSKAASGLSV
jgi:glutamate/tyrosine decarboxylase-like PLP-dependent enzyme